jgi:hypothetical protein
MGLTMFLILNRTQKTLIGLLQAGVPYDFDLKDDAQSAVAKRLLGKKFAKETTLEKIEAAKLAAEIFVVPDVVLSDIDTHKLLAAEIDAGVVAAQALADQAAADKEAVQELAKQMAADKEAAQALADQAAADKEAAQALADQAAADKEAAQPLADQAAVDKASVSKAAKGKAI